MTDSPDQSTLQEITNNLLNMKMETQLVAEGCCYITVAILLLEYYFYITLQCLHHVFSGVNQNPSICLQFQ